VDHQWLEHIARLNRLHVLAEQRLTVGMDKGRRMQANEFLTGITVHRACRGIGLDYAPGLHIVDDQPVAGSFKYAPIVPFFAHMGLG
jgi:hypothetical protein